MLIWNAWRWLRGYVTFRAEGGLCERFFSLLNDARPPLPLWDIQRINGAVIASCRAADYRRLRPAARRTGTRVHAVCKRGLPFGFRPLAKRGGIVIGAACAMVLYMVLGSRIWIVDVQVDDPVLAARIEARLAQHGVTLGARMSEVDVPSIRMQAIAEIEEINQLSLYFDGSIARVGVQLQKESASPPDKTPADIIAAQDGLIVSMQTTIGHAAVKTGEAVVKGDLLVSGTVVTEKGTLLRHADAIVLAQTTHVFEQRVSLHELTEQQGRVIEQPSLRLLSYRLPLYSQAAFDDTWTVSTAKHFITVCGTTLPIGVESVVYTEQIHTPVTHTKPQAEQLARERLQTRAAKRLADAEIRDVTMDGVWEGEVYHLRATYECVENIAQSVPLAPQ